MTATFRRDGGSSFCDGLDSLMSGPVNVTFYGVRGSTPCSDHKYLRHGGNTSCVVIESPGDDPIIFDLGTGLRTYGEEIVDRGVFHGTTLLTHFHWDHVQGLPFFAPLLREGASMSIYAPAPESGGTACEAFASFIRDPLFPVTIEELPCTINTYDVADEWFTVGGDKVLARLVPHAGRTLGFRVERLGLSIAYVSDHQQPADGSLSIAASVAELAHDVDLLIHDAQYTPEQFDRKRTWGHSTIEYAVHVAIECGAKQLALFHHDPTHDDDELDRLAVQAIETGERHGVEVFSACELMTVSYEAR
jgi:phosphoribosyl 1,2-cyclic phosphodiesterase